MRKEYADISPPPGYRISEKGNRNSSEGVLVFEATDRSIVSGDEFRMGTDSDDHWGIVGEGGESRIYAGADEFVPDITYTVKAAPNTKYAVIFYTSLGDPGSANLDISWDRGKSWDISYRHVNKERVVETITTDSAGIISFVLRQPRVNWASLNYFKLVKFPEKD